MATREERILEIAGAPSTLRNGQRCILDTSDPELGVKAPGHKAHDGSTGVSLVKGANAYVPSIQDANMPAAVPLADGANPSLNTTSQNLLGAINELHARPTGVVSFNGRTDVVVPAPDDYNAGQIIDGSTAPGAYVEASLTNHEGRITTAETDIVTNASDITDLQDYNTTVQIATKERTGFYNADSAAANMTYDPVARTITIAANSEALYRDIPVPELAGGSWVSDPHPASPTSLLFLYHNGTTFVWDTSPWNFWDLQIAAVSYNSAGSFLNCFPETHGTMSWQSHKSGHYNIGTYLISGGDGGGFVPLSITPADRRPTVSQTVMCDEDVCHTLDAHTTQNDYSWSYLTGPTGLVNITRGNPEFVPGTATRIQYNEFTGATWQLTNVPNNSYVSFWRVDVPASQDSISQQTRYAYTPGQSVSATLDEERAKDITDLQAGELVSLAPEFRIAEQIICYQTPSNWYIVESNKIVGTRISQVVGGSGLSVVSVDNVTTKGNGTPLEPINSGYWNFVPFTTGTYIVAEDLPNNSVILADAVGVLEIEISSAWIAKTGKNFRVISKSRPRDFSNWIKIYTEGGQLFNNFHSDVSLQSVDLMLEFATDGTGVWYKD
jgi:hypothetical protein